MNNFKLWYNGPAAGWAQGLPIGNGRIGAVVHEGLEQETWNMTEVTYWSGKSERITGSPDGKAALEQMREPFFKGDYAAGDRLAKEFLQPKKGNFGTHLRLCDVVLRYGDQMQSVVRELNLETAVAEAAYRGSDYTIARETFASHPAGIVVSRIKGDKPGKVSFTLRLEGRTKEFTASLVDPHTLVFSGQALEDVHSNGQCGVLCQGELAVKVEGGTVQSKDQEIIIEGADEAVIYFAVHTDYAKSGQSWIADSRRQVQAAQSKDYVQLKEEHLSDYQSLYKRVSVNLGSSPYSELPTDERTRRLRDGHTDDPALTALFYQYGRYLTIAGSRADSPLPLNLQGLWNDGEANRMAWSCDYHLDVNTEMNYYPTEISNLAECHVPLMNYIGRLAEAGRLAAKDFYGCDGWVAHVFSNAWGFTVPAGRLHGD